jgi:hypothetical protein
VSYAAAAAASAQVNAPSVPAAAGMSDLLGGLSVDVPTVSYLDHHHHKLSIPDLVHHAIVPYSHSVEVVGADELL